MRSWRDRKHEKGGHERRKISRLKERTRSVGYRCMPSRMDFRGERKRGKALYSRRSGHDPFIAVIMIAIMLSPECHTVTKRRDHRKGIDAYRHKRFDESVNSSRGAHRTPEHTGTQVQQEPPFQLSAADEAVRNSTGRAEFKSKSIAPPRISTPEMHILRERFQGASTSTAARETGPEIDRYTAQSRAGAPKLDTQKKDESKEGFGQEGRKEKVRSESIAAESEKQDKWSRVSPNSSRAMCSP